MARWIHEFRSSGERALTGEERRQLSRRCRVLSVRRIVFAILAAGILPLGIVAGIAIAADPNPVGWAIMIGSFVPFGYLLTWSNAAGKLALLHRRALRLGLIEEFVRVRGDETVRWMWQRTSTQVNAPEDEEEFAHLDPYWSHDERFEEDLKRTARSEVRTFEAVGRDGAVLWVEGHPVRKIIEPSVWEAVD